MGIKRSTKLVLVLALSGLSAHAVAENGAPQPTFGKRLTAARETLASQRARQTTVESRLASMALERQQVEARLESDGRAYYRLSRGGLLPMASGLGGLLGHASRMERLERVIRSDMARLKQLDAESQALRREAGDLTAKVRDAESTVASVEQSRAGYMQQQLNQAVFEPRSAPAPAPSPGRISYGLSVVGGTTRGRFVEQRGSLAMPISGSSSIQAATRAESSGPGLEFGASSGAAVRAVAGGRVVFSDRYGSYGQLVILDHGDRYYTVYGGFASADVQVGDEVSKSARLGSAGADPVYFEVRRGTKTEDARQWLGL